jgi:hypothetical protein
VDNAEYKKLKRRARMMLLLVVATRRRVAKLRRPQLKVVEGFDSFDININFQSFTDTFFDEHIGFAREDCEKIYDELKSFLIV